MPSQGYVRYPTIHQDQIVFISEDDLWLVLSEGGRAEAQGQRSLRMHSGSRM